MVDKPMMSGLRAISIAFAFGISSVAALAGSNDPSRVPLSHEVDETLQQVRQAAQEGDYQLALALVEGTLLSKPLKMSVSSSTPSRMHTQAAKVAVKTWNRVLKGDFPVQYVEDEDEADLIIEFVPYLDSGFQATLGHISFNREYRWSKAHREYRAYGKIKVALESQGQKLSHSEIRGVVLHELGHLLGLEDTSDSGVLMGIMMRGEPILEPTQAEINAVVALRARLREYHKGLLEKAEGKLD